MSPSRGSRPPWWPEGERWPPRRRPRHLLRLLFFVFLVWLAVTALVGTAVGTFASGHETGVWAVLLAVIVLLLFAGRGRRFGGPGMQLRRLRESARRLEQADSRRRTFLADLAHELRTPLAVIRAQAEAISEGVYTGDAEHVAPILDATGSLEGLVDDLRTLAESDAGALELTRTAVDVEDLLREVAAAQQGGADAAGVALSADAPEGLPAVDGDATRLRRALVNLVANAVAHTPSGGSVRLQAAADPDGVAITVVDTGTGMEPALAARAFDRFVKEPGSRGSGLGLAIAKEIVEAHAGRISLESRPDQGTTVRLTLPRA